MGRKFITLPYLFYITGDKQKYSLYISVYLDPLQIIQFYRGARQLTKHLSSSCNISKDMINKYQNLQKIMIRLVPMNKGMTTSKSSEA